MEPVVTVTSSLEELQTEVSKELLRGVSLDVCMGGFGWNFERPEPGMFRLDQRLYQQSKQMSSFHSFLSHDWGTSRWLKFMSLMVIYNSRAAFVCSLLVSLLVGILRAGGIIPDALWVELSVYAVFPVVLCFWQRIRAHILRHPIHVFFDKLCIPQHDEDLKRQAVFGLAGFLDHAEQLTVIWSHRYFSRLWCTYEISTFLRDPKPKPILVMPAKLAVILLVFSAALHLVNFGFSVLQDAREHSDHDPMWLTFGSAEFRETSANNALYLPFLGPVMPLLFYIGLGMIEDLAEFPNQLKMFKVQDAECFCCSNNHCHPETGEELPCDRVLVFKTLRRWYGKETDEKGACQHLERFNQTVQEELAPKVLQRMGSDLLPLNYSLYVILPGVLPSLASLIPKIAAGHPGDLGPLQVIWAFRLLIDWTKNGMLALFWIRISTRLWLLAVRYRQHCLRSRVALAILLPLPAGLLLSLILFSTDMCLVMSEDDSMLPLIPFAFWLLLLCWLWSSTTSTAHLSAKLSMPVTVAKLSPTSKDVEVKLEDSEPTFSV